MGIYIKGMQMPKRCIFCSWLQKDLPSGIIYCTATYPRIDISSVTIDRRHDDCPLVEVPAPHGRLIDASEEIQVQMYDDQHEDFYQVKMTIDDLLSQSWIDAKSPTVIPAEEEQ